MVPRAPLVAILDDEPDFRRALSRLFASHGYDTVAFASGHTLLAAVEEHRFDCITIDLDLPGMSGFDVLAALRTRADGPPVIVITGHDAPDGERRAAALAVCAYHRKPVRSDTLIAAVKHACAATPPDGTRGTLVQLAPQGGPRTIKGVSKEDP